MLRTGGVSGARLESRASPGGVAEPVQHRQLRGAGLGRDQPQRTTDSIAGSCRSSSSSRTTAPRADANRTS